MNQQLYERKCDMGYTSTCEGEFRIVPPLTHQETKKLFSLMDQLASGYAEIKVSNRERVTETDEGDMISFEAYAIKPKNGSSEWKRYDTDQQVQKIVTAFPGHTYEGHFEFLGEDGDRWRIVVRNGKVTEIHPKLTWPEV